MIVVIAMPADSPTMVGSQSGWTACPRSLHPTMPAIPISRCTEESSDMLAMKAGSFVRDAQVTRPNLAHQQPSRVSLCVPMASDAHCPRHTGFPVDYP